MLLQLTLPHEGRFQNNVQREQSWAGGKRGFGGRRSWERGGWDGRGEHGAFAQGVPGIHGVAGPVSVGLAASAEGTLLR